MMKFGSRGHQEGTDPFTGGVSFKLIGMCRVRQRCDSSSSSTALLRVWYPD